MRGWTDHKDKWGEMTETHEDKEEGPQKKENGASLNYSSNYVPSDKCKKKGEKIERQSELWVRRKSGGAERIRNNLFLSFLARSIR